MAESRSINTGGGDYREIHNSDNAQYAEGNIVNLNSEQQKTLAEAAAEIQALLEQLESTYAIDTPEGRQQATEQAVKQIDGNAGLKSRLFSAGRAFAFTAVEKGVENPLVAPLVAALKDLYQTQPKK
mgnify:CR=1 FL=1